MDLTNKQVKVAALSVTSFPPETTVKVEIKQEVVSGIYKNIGTYEITFNVAYTSVDEAGLLAAINEKLALIPD